METLEAYGIAPNQNKIKIQKLAVLSDVSGAKRKYRYS